MAHAEREYLRIALVPGTRVICQPLTEKTAAPKATVIDPPFWALTSSGRVWLEIDDPVPQGWCKTGTLDISQVEPLPRPLGPGQARLEI
jgi:hypothetical protein